MDNTPAEHLARQEDTRNGRVVPTWKYNVEYYLLCLLYAVGIFIGRNMDLGSSGWLIHLAVLFPALVLHALVLGPYRRRSFH